MNASFTRASFNEDPSPINETQRQYLTRWKAMATLWIQGHIPVITTQQSLFIKSRVFKCIENIDAANTVYEYHRCVRVIDNTTFLMNEYIFSINHLDRPLYLPTFRD